MGRMTRRWVVLAALVLAGCFPRNNLDLPVFATAQVNLPPLAPGMARLYFYRQLEPYESLSVATLMLNGTLVGSTRNGGVWMHDVVPGTYTITVPTSTAAYPYQFPTLSVTAGQSWYLRIASLSLLSCDAQPDSCSGPIFVVQPMPQDQARIEMAPLGLQPN